MQMTLDISAEQSAKLDELSAQRSVSPPKLVAEALDAYLQRSFHGMTDTMAAIVPSPITDPEERKQHLLNFFGACPNIGDGMAFQDRMRNEWVREWDPAIHG